jgi:hypothetical protein
MTQKLSSDPLGATTITIEQSPERGKKGRLVARLEISYFRTSDLGPECLDTDRPSQEEAAATSSLGIGQVLRVR